VESEILLALGKSTSESLLDVGCGARVDTLIAGIMVGNTGKAIGIDIVPEMLRRAQENSRMTELNNISFWEASGEALPFFKASFDAVISNGVFNLIPDKLKALKETYRVLKSFGRLMIADQIFTTPQDDDIDSRIDNWAG
jgi:ubiquinone/menaquinone biosynthesis C-methylase UbiE